MNEKQILLANLNKIHTTELGVDRIKMNLNLDTADIVAFCKKKLQQQIVRFINKEKIIIA